MNGKNNLAKYLTNANFSEIIRQLTYKAKWYDKKNHHDRYLFSKCQMCSSCKIINKDLKDLSIRNWECPNCHTIHDRDTNASLNILNEGMRIYKNKNIQLSQ